MNTKITILSVVFLTLTVALHANYQTTGGYQTDYPKTGTALKPQQSSTTPQPSSVGVSEPPQVMRASVISPSVLVNTQNQGTVDNPAE